MRFDAAIIILMASVVALIIERIFYYKLKYSTRTKEEREGQSCKIPEADNPGHGERIATLEKGQEALEKSNEKDHELIRRDIRKIFSLINGMRK